MPCASTSVLNRGKHQGQGSSAAVESRPEQEQALFAVDGSLAGAGAGGGRHAEATLHPMKTRSRLSQIHKHAGPWHLRQMAANECLVNIFSARGTWQSRRDGSPPVRGCSLMYTRLVSNSTPTWSSRCCFTACCFYFGKSSGRNAIRIEPY